MHIFITGATGYIGQPLIASLIKQKHNLTLAVRNPSTAQALFPQAVLSKCKVIQADFKADHAADDWMPRLQGIDIVINAVGIFTPNRQQSFEALHVKAPLALFEAASIAGVKQVIQISALGADDTAETQYHISKRTADQSLQQLDIESLIIRPSIIYGPNARSWTLFRALAAFNPVPLIDEGRAQLQPIHIDDLVKAITIAAQRKPAVTGMVDAVGSECITFKALLAKHHLQMNRSPAVFLRMPVKLAMLLSRLARAFGSQMISPDSLTMLQSSSYSDPHAFTSHFGFTPRALTFAPITRAERLEARTFFVPTALRFSIALVWFWTALVSAFIYPVADSLALLAQTGLTGGLALTALYGASVLDFMLGLAVLTRFKPFYTTLAQLALIVGYSVILTIFIPALWQDPFGPLIKNLPMIAAILTLYAMEH